MLSFQFFFILPASPSFPSHCALQDVFCQASRSCDVSILSSFVSSDCDQDVFVLSNVSTDYLSDFFIGDIVCVRNAQDVLVTSYPQSLYSSF